MDAIQTNRFRRNALRFVARVPLVRGVGSSLSEGNVPHSTNINVCEYSASRMKAALSVKTLHPLRGDVDQLILLRAYWSVIDYMPYDDHLSVLTILCDVLGIPASIPELRLLLAGREQQTVTRRPGTWHAIGV